MEIISRHSSYRKTLDGKINTIFQNQKINSKSRGHKKPLYSKKEFVIWCKSSKEFIRIYEEWVLSGYIKDLNPSIDRLNDYLPYSFDNIRVCTWRENYKKSHQDMKNGINNKRNSKIDQICLSTGKVINTFYSLSYASRKLSISRPNISKCLGGSRKSSGGFGWRYTKNPKILILGDARHGKDTIAEMICEKTGLKFASSSRMALEIFLFDLLKEKYNISYSNKEEAYEDRVNHRTIWYDEICLYNAKDKTRLVKDILNVADIYVGLRNYEEVEQSIKENTFDYIIGIYDHRKPRESESSNTADVLKYSDFVILNNGDLIQLQNKVDELILKIF